MSVTIEDCLRLPSLKDASVYAGFAGLYKKVVSISVLENASPEYLIDEYFEINRNNNCGEMVITCFFSVQDDVAAQLATIRRLHEGGEVAIILFYLGAFIKELDPSVIELCNLINMPLICMPKGRMDCRYSEVITEVMELIFRDQMLETNFVNEMLERISNTPIHKRNIDLVFRWISDRIRCSLILVNEDFVILNRATWPISNSLSIESVVAQCKMLLKTQSKDSQLTLTDNERSIYAKYMLVDRNLNHRLYLITLSESSPLEMDLVNQAQEVVQLFLTIWGKTHSDVKTSELVRAILTDEPLKMRRLAELLHIDIAAIHNMWILKKINKSEEDQNSLIISKLQSYLTEHGFLHIIDNYENDIIVFMDNPKLSEDMLDLANDFLTTCHYDKEDYKIVMMVNLENTQEARDAYVLCKEHLDSAMKIYPHSQIITLSQIAFAKECKDLLTKGEQELNHSLQILRPILTEDTDNELLHTLTVYLLDASMNVITTSELMFVHKNTIKYRLHRIQEKLNYKMLYMPESIDLYRAVALKRLLLPNP